MPPEEAPGGVAVAAAPAATTTLGEVPMYQQEKKGGKCFGCCCDYRRAVIILSIISIVLGIIGLISQSTTGNNTSVNDISDDEIVKDIEEITDSYKTGSIVLAVIGFVMSLIALGGGITFNWMMVGISVIYVIISFIVGIILGLRQFNEIVDYLDETNYGTTTNGTTIDGDTLTESEEDDLEAFIRMMLIVGYVIAGIITALFVYPSFCFIQEVRSGIMSKETYPREEHSCCCMSERRTA